MDKIPCPQIEETSITKETSISLQNSQNCKKNFFNSQRELLKRCACHVNREDTLYITMKKKYTTIHA